MENMLTNIMGSMGRGGDNMVGHLSHGDVVIPKEIILQNPEFLTKFKKAMEDNHQDYRGHVAGSGYENKNPHTGASEFFFGGLKNFLSNPAKQVTNFVSNPISGIENIAKTSNPLNAVPGGSGMVDNMFNSLGMGGSSSSSGMSGTAGATSQPTTMPAPDLGAVTQPFTPKRPDAAVQPFDLFSSSVGGQQFSTLDPTQQRSYLATQGTSGGGLGGDAKDYYMNLLQRNLIDENGQQQNINSALLPVERNYLSSLGLPTGNTQDFFQALQKT